MTATTDTRRADSGGTHLTPHSLSIAPDQAQPLVPLGTLLAVVAHARQVSSLAREEYARQLDSLAEHESVMVVHTCHRVEVYVAGIGGAGAGAGAGDIVLPVPPTGARRLSDLAAARHLITVACGLESAVLGEDQILHQLRESVSTRRTAGPLDPVLDRLFQGALHAGRRAHSLFGSNRSSLADVAMEEIAERSGRVAGRAVVVVGAGSMGSLAAYGARRHDAHVLVASRSSDRAERLASGVRGDTVPWQLTGVEAPAGVVVALSGPWPIDDDAARRLVDSTAVVVDLSSPPATPDALQTALGDRFIGVDDLSWADHGGLSANLQDSLDVLVADTGREFCRWLRARHNQPTMRDMADVVEARRVEELTWLLNRLPALGERDRATIEQMSHRLVAGILHAPRVALRADESGELDHAARELFGL